MRYARTRKIANYEFRITKEDGGAWRNVKRQTNPRFAQREGREWEGAGPKGRSTKYEGRKGMGKANAREQGRGSRKCGFRISDCGTGIKRRNHGSTSSLRSEHPGSKTPQASHEIRTARHPALITSCPKAQWPNKPIWLQIQGRNGLKMGIASRGVGDTAGRDVRSAGVRLQPFEGVRWAGCPTSLEMGRASW